MAASSTSHQWLFLFLIPVLPFSSSSSSSPSDSFTIPNCNRNCSSAGDQNNGKPRVPYPFGFSPGCEIQLNCSRTGEIKIGEFSVQNMTSDSILVDIPGNCNRSVRSLYQLFGRHYRMTTRNGILLRNCSSIIRECTVPAAMLKSQFGNHTCDSMDTMSCYSDAYNNTFTFLDLDRIKEYDCGEVFSSIAFDTRNGWEMPLRPKLQTAELGWWLDGNSCKCSRSAKCVTVSFGSGGVAGYRCQCMEGYVGDGFIAGDGCRKGPNAGRSKLRIIPVLIAAGGVVVLVGILVFFCFRRKLQFYEFLSLWKGKTNDNHDVEAILKKYGSVAPKRYYYSELKKMTNTFEIKLGQGGYGSVYKGKTQDGTPVAVKLLTNNKESNNNKGNGEEFINEVVSISRTSHINIVTLLGFCYQGDKKALVYEFMENGSLDKFIYSQQLDWPTLYRIAVEIARGLEYLHRGCNTKILHFDIKPHNILLDKDFCPKISDFGLAKLCPGKESAALSSLMTTVARGTIGYIAPEVIYRSIGGVSHKSDVYSYGMMVLEMVGGRKNVNVGADRSSEVYFPDWIYTRLDDHQELGLSGMMLDEGGEGGGGEENQNLARKMIIVSLWCIQTHPSNRPTITNVLDMLEGPLEALRMPPKPFFSSPSTASLSSSSSSSIKPFSC